MNWIFEKQVPVNLALIELSNLHVTDEKKAFERLVECAEHYADLYQWTSLADIPGVQNARQFFRAIGVDPTKRRPSSEALLNRALKKKVFYTINTLVDVGNWCSLDFLLPTCIYDADNIKGDVSIRLGQAGERYLALNNREIDFKDRFVLVDEIGPFGSPMTDSQRTAVTLHTKNAALGIWAPVSIAQEKLADHTDLFAKRATEYCGGTVEAMELFLAG